MKLAVSFLLILSLAAAPLMAAPATKLADLGWWRVEKLEKGTEVLVLDKAGSTVHSYVDRVDDSSLLLRNHALLNRFDRADVREVAVIGKGKGSSLGAEIGLAVGFLAAPWVGIALFPYSARWGARIGLPILAGIAGYHARREPELRMIYRAES